MQLAALTGLSALPWRRVDVSWHQAPCPGSAHEDIQHTRAHNTGGAPVLAHLVAMLEELEG